MAKAPKKPRKKATNGYKMPDPLPFGEVLTDIAKKQWVLGTSIGKGGFGEIYECKEASSKGSKYPYVVKIEPHGNGPLFVEMHFYMKNAKQADIEAFMHKHKLKSLGVPVYLGSGSHEAGGTKYRFIVMERFGTDIDKLRTENNGVLPATAVFQLAWQITNILEYIHDCGYVHADIKGGNVLLGASPATKNQAALVDFGLATKFTTEKQFKPNPKKAHDGTIEYLSRDAHQGVPTRRGDFEILGYNIIHWLTGHLPWELKLDDPKEVQQLKENKMNNIPHFVRSCLKNNQECVVKFLEYVDNLSFDQKPDYKKIRTLFEQEVTKIGGSIHGSLELHSTARKRRSVGRVDSDDENKVDDVKAKKPLRKREKKQDEQLEEDDQIDKITVRKREKKQKEEEDMQKPVKRRENKQQPAENGEEVMTAAMKEVLARKKVKDAEKKKKTQTKKEKVNGMLESTNQFEGFTAEMIEIHNKKMNKKEKSPERRIGRNLPVVDYSEQMVKINRRK